MSTYILGCFTCTNCGGGFDWKGEFLDDPFHLHMYRQIGAPFAVNSVRFLLPMFWSHQYEIIADGTTFEVRRYVE